MGRELRVPRVDDRHRILPEADLIDMLLLAGWAFELEAGGRDAAEAVTRAALEAWIAAGLGFRTGPSGERLFDPVETVQVLKWLGLKGEDRFWADRYVATGHALVASLAGATRFEVDLRRSFDLSGFPPDARLRLRVPTPLAGGDHQDLWIEPQLDEGVGGDVVQRDGFIDLRCTPPTGGAASIGFKATFATGATPADAASLTPEARELYLRPAKGMIQVTPGVAALAERLGGATPRQSVARFWDHLLDDLVCGPVRYSDLHGRAPVDWVLDTGWYDCQMGSALLISLCRARGVPARLVGGHVLYPLAPTNHFWSEIWFEGEGWRPYDLLCWDLSTGGQDAGWRNRFAGTVDARLVTQRLPLAFTGPMSVRFPPAWQLSYARSGEGIAVTFRDVADGGLIYRETISVSPSVAGLA